MLLDGLEFFRPFYPYQSAILPLMKLLGYSCKCKRKRYRLFEDMISFIESFVSVILGIRMSFNFSDS